MQRAPLLVLVVATAGAAAAASMKKDLSRVTGNRTLQLADALQRHLRRDNDDYRDNDNYRDNDIGAHDLKTKLHDKGTVHEKSAKNSTGSVEPRRDDQKLDKAGNMKLQDTSRVKNVVPNERVSDRNTSVRDAKPQLRASTKFNPKTTLKSDRRAGAGSGPLVGDIKDGASLAAHLGFAVDGRRKRDRFDRLHGALARGGAMQQFLRSVPALRAPIYEVQGLSDEQDTPPSAVPSNELDMLPATGERIETLRRKNRLCHRHMLMPEGPKYDSKGRAYEAAHAAGAAAHRNFAHTRAPRQLLPRCCNCCRKSVLGCE